MANINSNPSPVAPSSSPFRSSRYVTTSHRALFRPLIGTGIIVREEWSFSVEEAVRTIPTGRARAFVPGVDAGLENNSGVGKLGEDWIAGLGDWSELW